MLFTKQLHSNECICMYTDIYIFVCKLLDVGYYIEDTKLFLYVCNFTKKSVCRILKIRNQRKNI